MKSCAESNGLSWQVFWCGMVTGLEQVGKRDYHIECFSNLLNMAIDSPQSTRVSSSQIVSQCNHVWAMAWARLCKEIFCVIEKRGRKDYNGGVGRLNCDLEIQKLKQTIRTSSSSQFSSRRQPNFHNGYLATEKPAIFDVIMRSPTCLTRDAEKAGLDRI